MARNTKQLIEWLDGCATDLSEVDRNAEAIDYQVAANTLRKFQSALISIALCQGAVPSHQAQKILEDTGHCYHFNQKYRAEVTVRTDSGHATAPIGSWHCPDCDESESERLVPYR